MTLARIQQRFHATVTGAEGLGLADWPPDMRAGLAVYRTAYRARLLDCLRDGFAKTRRWIGDESFDAAAVHHLILHPPASWTLDDIGCAFSDTLGSLFPDDPEVEELAWLESEMQQVFTAADVPPLTPGDFAQRTAHFTQQDWPDLRLAFVSAVRSRAIRTDCGALWSAIDQDTDIPSVTLFEGGGLSTLIIWRHDLRSRFRLLDADEASGLALARSGATFEQLCSALVRSKGEQGGVAAAGTMLGRWISDGLIFDASVTVAAAEA